MNRTFTLFGSHGVGKTALINRLNGDNFENNCYEYTGNHTKIWSNVDIGGERVDIVEHKLFDSNSGDYHLTENHKSSVKGIIVMFSVENRLTYKTAQDILAKIQCYYDNFSDIPVLLYGNKTDIIDERTVTVEEVLAFIAEKKYSNVIYKETSLKLNDKQFIVNDINTVFKLL